MKKIMILSLALCFPLLCLAAEEQNTNLDSMKCYGIKFDLKKNKDGRPVSIELKKEDQQFHLMFEGKIEGNEYRVVLQKSTNEIYAYINRPDGEMLASSGIFDRKFELGAHRGVMIPVQSTALSCIIE